MSIPSPFCLLPLAQASAVDVTTGPATPTNQTVVAPGAPTALIPGTQPTTEPKTQPSFFSQFGTMIPIILMFLVLYLVLFRGQKKEEKRRKALIAEMKKGDRVMTIGGLIGRVVSIDNDEVVLKIDESANVKATYKKSSIQQVLVPGDEKPK